MQIPNSRRDQRTAHAFVWVLYLDRSNKAGPGSTTILLIHMEWNLKSQSHPNRT